MGNRCLYTWNYFQNARLSQDCLPKDRFISPIFIIHGRLTRVNTYCLRRKRVFDVHYSFSTAFYQRVINQLNARPHIRSVSAYLSYYNDHRSRAASRIISIVRARHNDVSWLVGALNESLVLTNHSIAPLSIGQDICQHYARGDKVSIRVLECFWKRFVST